MAAGIKHQQPFLSVPFRQHETFGRLAVDSEGVQAGAMGVAVDETADVEAAEGVGDGVLIHVHDVEGFTALVEAALEAVPAGVEFAHPEGFGEGIGLPGR